MLQPRRIADFHRRYIPKWPDLSCVLDFQPGSLVCRCDDDFYKARGVAASSSSLRPPLKKLISDASDSFSLDKSSGKKCYMISARALSIVWADTPHYWKWISLPDSRFEEVAELVSVCWLEIRGKIGRRMLSPSTLYKAYLVFKSTAGAYGFDHQPVEVSVGMLGGEEPTRHTVFLDAERGQNAAYHIGPGPRRIGLINRRHFLGYQSSQPREINEAQYPKERDDGWLEIEMGEFFCQGGGDGGDGGDGELEMACLEVTSGHWKGGLIVQGIEIRPKIKD